MFGYNVPNCGKGVMNINCNFEGYIDRKIFGGPPNIYDITDPEGIISTLTSFTTMYLGLHFCRIMM